MPPGPTLRAAAAAAGFAVCLCASAADKDGCRDPAWAPARMPGFEIVDCPKKSWVSIDIDLPAGTKTVEGRRSVVAYELKDESKDPANETVRRFYADQAKKAGARIQSDPNGGFMAVFTQKTAQGEFWYVYAHGSGNDQSTGSYYLTTYQVAPLAQEVQVRAEPAAVDADGAKCHDPAWLVRQFAAFQLQDCSLRDLDSVSFDLADGSRLVAGRVMEHRYVLADPTQDPVPLAVWKNYVNALQGIGARLLSDPRDANHAVLQRKTAQGELWYLYEHGSGNEESTGDYRLLTLQAGGPPANKCTLLVYGINFDFDQATWREESLPVLEQVRALYAAEPTYSAEIGGHTDNQGERAYNLKLSSRRAEAVKAWLVGKGIAAERITTAGYGDTRPLVPNTSDENKARNRRVELRRAGCKG